MKTEMYEQTFAVEHEHWWFRARGRIIAAVLRKVGVPAGAKILDIGCGTGSDLYILSPFGAVTGVDVFPEAIEYCKKLGFSSVELQDATNLQFPDASFNVVCCLDVLNGIQDDAKAVSEALRVLKPGGVLLFTVGANPSLWGQTDIASQHVRRYTKDGLLEIFRNNQCEVVRCTFFNTFLFPLAWLSRKLEKPSESAKEIPGLSLPPKVLNALLQFVFGLERFIVPYVSLPFGVSLMVVARKRL